MLDALLDTDAADQRVSRRAGLQLGTIIGLMLLTGAVHIAVEAALLAVLVGLTRSASRKVVVLGLATGAGLSLWRVLPAAIAFLSNLARSCVVAASKNSVSSLFFSAASRSVV